MDKKLDDSFLTCVQACDTIILLAGMDIKSLLANSSEFVAACTTVLGVRLTELPDSMVDAIAKLQIEIIALLGQDVYEDFNGSSRPDILYV